MAEGALAGGGPAGAARSTRLGVGCNCSSRARWGRSHCSWESGCCQRHRRHPMCRSQRGDGARAGLGRSTVLGGRRRKKLEAAENRVLPGSDQLAASFNHTANLPLYAINPSVIDAEMGQPEQLYMVRITPKSLCTKDWRRTSEKLLQNSFATPGSRHGSILSI